MERTYITEQTFEKVDFTGKALPGGEYESCTFVHCNLSDTDLSNVIFVDCTFDTCNLSTAKVNQTALRDVRFTGCKLTGLRFDQCDKFLFAVEFVHCQVDFSSFYGCKLRKTRFSHSSLREVDFTGADASSAVFDQCDLAGAAFENTVLEKADFRTAYHYSIDPASNRIKKAKFSLTGLAGLLNKYDIEIE